MHRKTRHPVQFEITSQTRAAIDLALVLQKMGESEVEEGWRSMWWYYLRHDPNLDSIRNEPEFQLIDSEIEADMSAQMQQIREMESRGEIAAVPGVIFNSE